MDCSAHYSFSSYSEGQILLLLQPYLLHKRRVPFGFVSCGFAEVEGFRRFATQHLALAFSMLWRAPCVCGVLFLHVIPAGLCSCMGWLLQGIWEHPRMPPVAPHLYCCTCSTWSGRQRAIPHQSHITLG